MILLSESSLGDVLAPRVITVASRSHEMFLALAHLMLNRGNWEAMADSVWDTVHGDVALALSALMGYVGENNGGNVEIAQYRHATDSGVNGGAAVASTANIRSLSLTVNEPVWAFRAGNVVTIDSGVYRFVATQCCFQTGHSRALLLVDNSYSNTYLGEWVYARVSEGHELNVLFDYYLSIDEESDLTLKTWTELAKATNGLGVAFPLAASNYYATLTLIRLGDV